MHYIGIHLAWGDKQPTGLAAIDDGARLLHVTALRTDDTIEAALAGYVAGHPDFAHLREIIDNYAAYTRIDIRDGLTVNPR